MDWSEFRKADFRHNIRTTIYIAAIGLACTLLHFGCGQEAPVSLTTLSNDLELTGPVELKRLATGHLVALVAEIESGTPTIYQGDSSGQTWSRLCDLPQFGDLTGTEIATGGNLLVVAAYGANQLTIATASLLIDSESDTLIAPQLETSLLSVSDPIQEISLAGSRSQSNDLIHFQLAYLTGEPSDSIRTIFHRWSGDRGSSWSNPSQLSTGVISSLDLAVAQEGSTGFNLAYTHNGFFQWRGIHELDHTAAKQIMLRIAPDSRNEIAKLGVNLFVTGDSPSNQVVGAFSDNNGYNWSMAMALANHADEPRRADLDAGFDQCWVTYTSGDSVLVARNSKVPALPRLWLPEIEVFRGRITGRPSIVALPDSTAGILFATTDNQVHFANVKKQMPPKTDE